MCYAYQCIFITSIDAYFNKTTEIVANQLKKRLIDAGGNNKKEAEIWE